MDKTELKDLEELDTIMEQENEAVEVPAEQESTLKDVAIKVAVDTTFAVVGYYAVTKGIKFIKSKYMKKQEPVFEEVTETESQEDEEA